MATVQICPTCTGTGRTFFNLRCPVCFGEGYVIGEGPNELRKIITEQQTEINELRRMLYDMTSLTDWKAAGYSEEEYHAIVAQFETAPAALDDTVEG